MFPHKIIDYQQLIDKSTQEFVGRAWVRKAVDDFLRSDSSRIFLLLGEPGSGKTAFMADLVKRRGYLHHFIGKGSRIDLSSSLEWRDPIRFAESIGYQLLRDYGGWVMSWEDWGIQVRQDVKELEGRLTGVRVKEFNASPRPAGKPKLSVEQEVERLADPAAQMIGVFIEKYAVDVERVVQQLLLAPLRKVAERWPDRTLVIIVDGLDEASDYSNPKFNILTILSDNDLPPNVRFLASSQPGTQHLTPAFLSKTHQFRLDTDTAGELNSWALADARAYLRRLFKEVLEPRANKIERGEFVKSVAGASEGNFLYLFHYANGLRESLAKGDETLLDLQALPKGLHGIYEDLLGKMRGLWEPLGWADVVKPVLGALSVAREPLSRAQTASFSGVEQERVGTVLLQIARFLDITGKGPSARYAIYHKSFAEYLLSEDNEDFISSQTANARCAGYFLNAWGGLENGLPLLSAPGKAQLSDGYGLRHLAHHLAAGDDTGVERLHRLLAAERADGRNAWAEAKVAGNDVNGYLADVTRAWEAAERESALLLEARAPAKSMGLEVRYTLMSASVAHSVQNVSPSLIPLLVRAQVWSPPRALGCLRQFGAFTRVMVLGVLRDLIPEPLFRQALEVESSEAVSMGSVPDEWVPSDLFQATTFTEFLLCAFRARYKLLSGDGAFLPERLFKVCRDGARLIKFAVGRGFALLALYDYSPDARKEALLREVLGIVQQTDNRFEYVYLMTALAPYLTETQTEELVQQFISAVAGDKTRAWNRDMLWGMDALLDGGFISRLHADEVELQRAAGAVNVEFANLSTEQFEQWLLTTLGDDPSLHLPMICFLLAGLAPRLDGTQLGRLVTATLGAPFHDIFKAQVLTSLLPALSEELIGEVVRGVMSFESEEARFRVLAEAIQRLPAPVREATLKEAEATIDNLIAAENAEADEVRELKGRPDPEWERQREERQRREYMIESLSILAANVPGLDHAPFLKLFGSSGVGAELKRRDGLLRLVPHLSEPLLVEAVEIARAFTWTSDRLAALTGMLPFLPEPARTRVRAEALESALSIEYRGRRSTVSGNVTVVSTEKSIDEEAVAKLAPHLSAEELARALKKVQEIGNSYLRQETLIKLAPYLPAPLLREVLEDVQAIDDADAQAELLSALAACLLDAGHEQEAVAVVRAIKDKHILTRALLHAAARLPWASGESLLAEAEAAARGLDASYYRRRGELPPEGRATALADIAGGSPEPARAALLKEAVKSERSAGWHPWHEATLAQLCERVAELGHPDGAFKTAGAIKELKYYARALVATARHAPENILREVLTAALTIEDRRVLSQVLSDLAPLLPEHLRAEALEFASSLPDGRERLFALASFIPFLPTREGEEIEESALGYLSQAEDNGDKVSFIASLAASCTERIRERLLRLGLDTLRKLHEPGERYGALASLRPHLSESLLREALEIIGGIEDTYWREWTLTQIAARVAEVLGPRQALDVVHGIETMRPKATGLEAIAGHLDESLLHEAMQIPGALRRSPEWFARHDEVLHVGEKGWTQEKRTVAWSPEVAAFSALARHAPAGLGAEVYGAWREVLRPIAGAARENSLTQLRMLAPVLEKQGFAEALVEVARAVQDVARWWP